MFFKAVYPYDGPFAGSLKFTKNDLFLEIREENEFWHLVCKEDGSIGCVPTNYVQQAEINDKNLVAKFAGSTLKSFKHHETSNLKDNTAIIRILQEIMRSSGVTTERFSNLADSNVVSTAPQANTPKLMSIDIISTMKAVQNGTSDYAIRTDEQSRSDETITPELPFQLIDILRLGTNASYADCQRSFLAIFTIISRDVPSIKTPADMLCNTITNADFKQQQSSYMKNCDWFRLKRFFGMLESRQKNEQECNWQLHQDHNDLSQCLNKLLDLVVKVDAGLLRHYLSSSNYHALFSMIQFYQREHRPLLRNRLLLIIGLCCCIEPACVAISLQSVLPSELIRELNSCDSSPDAHHIALCIRLLTILLARATELTVDLKARLDSAFITRLLLFVGTRSGDTTTIESRQQQSDDFFDLILSGDPKALENSGMAEPQLNGSLSEAVVLLIVAINWHFCSLLAKRDTHSMSQPSSPMSSPTNDNSSKMTPVIRVLTSQPKAPSTHHFIELIVHLFNRDLDPIFLIDFGLRSSSTRTDDLLEQWFSVCNGPLQNGTHVMGDDAEEEDEEASALDSEDCGQYARRFWSDNLGSRIRQQRQHSGGGNETPVKLPSSVDPSTPAHSVFKLLFDVCFTPESACLVYRSDLEVIVDVINRQLCNLSPNSSRMPDYLLLFGLLMNNTDYLSTGKQAYKITEILSNIRSLLDMAATMPYSPSVKRSVDYATGLLTRMKCVISI